MSYAGAIAPECTCPGFWDGPEPTCLRHGNVVPLRPPEPALDSFSTEFVCTLTGGYVTDPDTGEMREISAEEAMEFFEAVTSHIDRLCDEMRRNDPILKAVAALDDAVVVTNEERERVWARIFADAISRMWSAVSGGRWSTEDDDMNETERFESLKWEFYTDKAGEFRWRVKHVTNGNTMFTSSEGYSDIRDAKNCAMYAGWVEGKSLTEEVVE